MSGFELKANFDIKALSMQAEMFPKSGNAAINRIAREVRTQAADEVSKRYNIKRSEVLDKITIKPATQSNLVVRIHAKSRELTVMRFDAQETTLGGGTVISIIRGKRMLIKTAFINKVKQGGTKGKLVMARLSKARYPLEAIRTISISEMIGTKKLAIFLGEHIDKRLPEELTRLIKLWNK